MMNNKKIILAFWVRNGHENLQIINFTWSMIWTLVKFRIFYRKRITVQIKSPVLDNYSHFVQFLVNKNK